MKLLDVLHHVFAIAAIVLSALLWWPLGIVFALLYLWEFLVLRRHTDDPGIPAANDTFYAPTRAETPRGFFADDSPAHASFNNTFDDSFDDSFEEIPVHDVAALQAAFEQLPDDAVITVENSAENPWQKALEYVREQHQEPARTAVPTPRADAMATVADDAPAPWKRAVAHFRAGHTGDDTPVTPVTGVPHHLREATKEEDE